MPRSIFGTTETQKSINEVIVYIDDQLEDKLDNNTGSMNGDLNMNNNNLTFVNQINGVNVTTKFNEVDTNTLSILNQQPEINNKLPLNGGTMTGTLNLTNIASTALETMLQLTPEQLTLRHQTKIEMKILSDLLNENKVTITANTSTIQNANINLIGNVFDISSGGTKIRGNSTFLLLQANDEVEIGTPTNSGITVDNTVVYMHLPLNMQNHDIVSGGLYNNVDIVNNNTTLNTHIANTNIHFPVDDANLGNVSTLWSSLKTESEIAVVTNSKGVAFGICPLDGAGKVPNTFIPPLALTKPFVYNTISERDADEANVQEGDVAIIIDEQKSYMYLGIYNSDPLLNTGQFIELATTGAINTVNGIGGSAVLITSDDVPEGITSLYYTTDRVFNDTISITDGSRQFTQLITFQQGVSIQNGLNMNASDITMNNGLITGLRTLANGNVNDAVNRGFVTTITNSHDTRLTAVEAKTNTLSIQPTGSPSVKGTIIDDSDNIFLRRSGADKMIIAGILTTNANTTITDNCTTRNINSISQTNIIGPTTIITASTLLTATSPTINLNNKLIQNATTTTITNSNIIINPISTFNLQYNGANKITVGTARTVLNNSELEMSSLGTLFHFFAPAFTVMNSTQMNITGSTTLNLTGATINLSGIVNVNGILQDMSRSCWGHIRSPEGVIAVPMTSYNSLVVTTLTGSIVSTHLNNVSQAGAHTIQIITAGTYKVSWGITVDRGNTNLIPVKQGVARNGVFIDSIQGAMQETTTNRLFDHSSNTFLFTFNANDVIYLAVSAWGTTFSMQITTASMTVEKMKV